MYRVLMELSVHKHWSVIAIAISLVSTCVVRADLSGTNSFENPAELSLEQLINGQ